MVSKIIVLAAFLLIGISVTVVSIALKGYHMPAVDQLVGAFVLLMSLGAVLAVLISILELITSPKATRY